MTDTATFKASTEYTALNHDAPTLAKEITSVQFSVIQQAPDVLPEFMVTSQWTDASGNGGALFTNFIEAENIRALKTIIELYEKVVQEVYIKHGMKPTSLI